jgi:hypothetical protein
MCYTFLVIIFFNFKKHCLRFTGILNYKGRKLTHFPLQTCISLILIITCSQIRTVALKQQKQSLVQRNKKSKLKKNY